MDETEIEVLIVGAGPTGLTLACDLARRGVRCRLVDGSPTAFPGSRGKGLQPRTLEVFDDLGVIETIFESGGSFPPFRGYSGHAAIWQRTFYEMLRASVPAPDPTIPFPAPLVIPQWRTDEILTARFAQLGGRVERGLRFAALEQNADHACATLVRSDDPSVVERVRARYLVGCDGGKSAVRKALGVSFLGETFESERTLIGDVCVDGLDRDVCHMLTIGGDMSTRVSLWPLPHTDKFQFIATVVTDDVPELTLAALQRMVDERWNRTSDGADTGPERRAIRLHDLAWLSVYRVNVRMVDRYRVARAFLAGDAAHVHSSSGGQGLNTSVQDAYNLGWKLSAVLRGAPDALLDSYEQERMPIAADVLGLTTRWHHREFRDVPLAGETPVSTTAAVPALYQLGLNYRGGPLAVDTRTSRGRVQAGDRAPDSPLRSRDVTGTKSRTDASLTLFDVFRGPHWTLLTLGTMPVEVGASVTYLERTNTRIVAVDREPDVCTTYDLRRPGNGSALVLVRPDGYVGFMSDESSVNAANELSAYVASVFGS